MAGTQGRAKTADRCDLIFRASPGQMLVLADTLLQQGKSADAAKILDLLIKDSDLQIRNEARFRRAAILLAQGSRTSAASLLRQILDERPEATVVRVELAQLLDRMGDKEGAWRQLRAVQASGLPPDVARLVDRFSEALRGAKPTGASFEIAIAPDSNISRATRSSTLDTVVGDFTIGKDSQATSGLGLSLRGQAFHRVSLNGSNALLLSLSGFADLYRKTRFDELALDAAAGPEVQIGSTRLNLEFGVTQRWYGQRPYMRSLRLAGVATRPLDSRTRLWLRGSASLVDNQLNDLEDGKDFSGKIIVERALTSTSGVSVSLAAERAALKDPGYSTKGWRLSGLVWRDVGRSTFTAELEAGQLKADERLQLFPEARIDRSLRVTLGATMRGFGYAGFAPVIRIVRERNRSSIAFYDYRRIRSEFALVRAF